MIHKKVISFNDLEELHDEPCVVCINSLKEFTDLDLFYKEYNSKIRGVKLNLEIYKLLTYDQIKNNNYNYFCIQIDNEITKIDLSNIKKQNFFLEVIINYEIYSEELINSLKNVDRIIISFEKKIEVNEEKLFNISSNLISKKQFPLFSNFPFCYGFIEQNYDFFNQVIPTNSKDCKDCVLINFCKKPDNIIPKPIKQIDKDILKFLKENEGITNRF